MTDPKQIHLVDDDAAIRNSASFMLRHAGYQVDTYEDGIKFLNHITTNDRGVILLDVRMPGMDGLGVLFELKERQIPLPVIILTGHGDIPMAVEAMNKGATDFLEKPYEKEALINSIKLAFDRLENQSSFYERQDFAQAKINTLTNREKDVLNLLVVGHTNKMIAIKLEISHRTVEIHRANLMDKLEVDNLPSLLKIAFSAGLGMSEEI